jgi:hypothetical protein
MPRLTRWLIRTALLWLALAFAGGTILAMAGAGTRARLQPMWIHAFTVGWLTQLVFGVAYWMFPRRSRELTSVGETLGWTGYVLLNAGLVLRLVSEPNAGLSPLAAATLSAAALLQLAASLTFVALLWPRVIRR